MVMYKQKPGLVAQSGTIGPQTSGGLLTQKKSPTYSVQSFAGTGPTPQGQQEATTSGIPWMPKDFWGQFGYRAANVFTGGQYGLDRAREYAEQNTPKAPPMPSAPLMTKAAPSRGLTQEERSALSAAFKKATGRDFATSTEAQGWVESPEYYVNLYNQYVPRATQTQVAQIPIQETARVASEQQFITPDFRLPTKSPVADLINPFGQEYGEGLMTKASARTARQFAPGRERLQQDLAMRGISPESPLFQSLMAQSGEREQMATGESIDSAMMEGMQRKAEWDRWKTGVEVDWLRGGADYAARLAEQPGRLESQQLQNSRQEIENELAKINLTVGSNPSVIRARIQEFADNARKLGNEIKAQEYLLIMNDPNAWWNNEIYKTAKEAGFEVVRGVSQGVGRTLAGGGR